MYYYTQLRLHDTQRWYQPNFWISKHPSYCLKTIAKFWSSLNTLWLKFEYHFFMTSWFIAELLKKPIGLYVVIFNFQNFYHAEWCVRFSVYFRFSSDEYISNYLKSIILKIWNIDVEFFKDCDTQLKSIWCFRNIETSKLINI